MKKIAFLSFVMAGTAFAAQTTGKYSALEGNWTGKITKNIKVTSAGGNPTAADTGAPASIKLSSTSNGLKGVSTTDGSSEEWVIDGDTYTWTDSEMSVTAKATTKLPSWVQSEIGDTKSGNLFAFEFSSCTLLKTKKPCEVKNHIPEGLNKGFWIFNVSGNKLTTSVLYQYPSGGTRHLSEELTK